MENGVVRIHPLDGKSDLEHLSSYWALNVHDNQHGAVRHIKTSFDDKYVFTAGMDGNFFVFKFMDKAVKGLKVPHKVSIPSPKVRVGSLSNDDGKGNEYGKRNTIGLVWQKNNLHLLFCTFLCLHDYDLKMPNWTFCVGRKQKTSTFFFFSGTSLQSFRIPLQFCQHLAN